MYEQDEENGYVWVSYGRIWSVLVKDFNLKRTEIQELIKDWLEGSYKLRGLTPLNVGVINGLTLGEAYNLNRI